MNLYARCISLINKELNLTLLDGTYKIILKFVTLHPFRLFRNLKIVNSDTCQLNKAIVYSFPYLKEHK